MGTDIDYLMLHGKTKPTRVKQKVTVVFDSIDIGFCPNFVCNFPYTFLGACKRRIDFIKFEAIPL